MATPRRLNFSSPCGVDDSPSSPPLTRRRSLRLLASNRPSSDPETKTKKKKKKKKKLGSSVNNMTWNDDDELALLKGLVDYRDRTSDQPTFDWDGFYGFFRGSIVANVSKNQLFSQIKKLKTRFLAQLDKIDQGDHLVFTSSRHSEAFGFSMMIWGQNETASASNEDMENGVSEKMEDGEETYKEDEEIANAEPFNDNGAAKAPDCNGQPPHEPVVDNVMENGTAGKETHEEATAADDLCALRDAFDTMVSQGLAECQKKSWLEKLINLETRKLQELSNEWKALLDEEAKLNVKKLRLSTKLAEAVTAD